VGKAKRVRAERGRPPGAAAAPGTSNRRLQLAAVAALVIVLALAAALAVVLLQRHGGGTASAGTHSTSESLPLGARLDRCGALAGDEAMRTCYSAALKGLVDPTKDPRPVVQRIADHAWAQPQRPLLGICHGLMHTVGREYAHAHGLKLATLMDYLPKSNDPGCSAGFAHGLVTGVAGQIDPTRPRAMAALCDKAGTRYRRYSCIHGFGHAFMRVYAEQVGPALRLCRALGKVEDSDCAQGVFHDYWFSVHGIDSTKAASPRPVTDPRQLCGAQAADFVRPCWYRAFVDSRPTGFQTASRTDDERLCAGLAGLQREACLTAASVIGPPDPAAQLEVCSAFRGRDAVSCIHGTKVQNLLGSSTATFVGVIRNCDRFPSATKRACYFWLGKTISVVTDGGFRRDGCPLLARAARDACVAGAKSMNGPLVTFS